MGGLRVSLFLINHLKLGTMNLDSHDIFVLGHVLDNVFNGRKVNDNLSDDGVRKLAEVQLKLAQNMIPELQGVDLTSTVDQRIELFNKNNPK